MVDGDGEYEFTTVRAFRGREARTIAKWSSDGWEFESQRQGPLRSELTFRRVKRITLAGRVAKFAAGAWGDFRGLEPGRRRWFLVASGGVIALVVGIGLVLGLRGGASAPQSSPTLVGVAVLSTQPASEKTSQEPVVVASSTPSDHETLTIENSKDLAAVLKVKDDCSATVASFASKHKGRIIAFDGNIAYMSRHDNYKTRYDILVNAGDYSKTSSIGPSFQFRDVNITNDLHLTGVDIPDSIGIGDNIHVVAQVGNFDSIGGCLFYLDPISTRVR